MGAEDYQAICHFKADRHSQVIARLENLQFVVVSEIASDHWSSFLIFESNDFFIEAEIRQSLLSLRYAVRQPASVVGQFSNILLALLPLMDHIKLVDNQPPAHLEDNMTLYNIERLVRTGFERKCSYWILDFPKSKTTKCLCRDAYADVIP